jgi:hypothetical protein
MTMRSSNYEILKLMHDLAAIVDIRASELIGRCPSVRTAGSSRYASTDVSSCIGVNSSVRGQLRTFATLSRYQDIIAAAAS